MTHRLDETSLTLADGRCHRLFRAIPLKPPPPGGFPVLYLLDGNAAFQALPPERLSLVPGLAVIGVGYDNGTPFAVKERWLDYTPALGPDGPGPDPSCPENRVGGAAAFLESLVGPIRTAAEEALAIDPSRRSLSGHSLGGLFTLVTLFTRPEAFAGYVPVSPSLWWGDGIMRKMEDEARFPPDTAIRVLIMLGDREVRSGQRPPLVPGPAPATMALIARLEGRPGLAVSSRVLAGMAHGPALAASLPFALRTGMEAG